MQPTEKQLAQFQASSEKATEGWAEFMDRFEKSLWVQERLQKLEELKKKTDKIKDFNFKNLGL